MSIALGLAFVAGDVLTCFVTLAFDHTHRFTVDKKHIVCWTGIGGIFADGNPLGGSQVELLHVLNRPARQAEFLVDLLACLGFGSHASLPPPNRRLFGSMNAVEPKQ